MVGPRLMLQQAQISNEPARTIPKVGIFNASNKFQNYLSVSLPTRLVLSYINIDKMC